MLQQILSHTPVYVWAILAFLVYRGLLALRDRDITAARLTIIPAIMLALALQSIGARYGFVSLAMAAWLAGSAILGLQRWAFGASRVTGGATPGSLRIRGSWTPLLLMLSIFVIKYAVAVVGAVQPQLAQGAAFAATSCGLLGLCNGYFLGQLARDIAAGRAVANAAQACSAPMPDPV